MELCVSINHSGFRRGDSTAWQLLRVVQSLHNNRHRSEYSLVCFFDLSKAFDTVWHRGLMAMRPWCFCGVRVLRDGLQFGSLISTCAYARV